MDPIMNGVKVQLPVADADESSLRLAGAEASCKTIQAVISVAILAQAILVQTVQAYIARLRPPELE
eukprot:3445283-Amphidinium_carterae.1